MCVFVSRRCLRRPRRQQFLSQLRPRCRTPALSRVRQAALRKASLLCYGPRPDARDTSYPGPAKMWSNLAQMTSNPDSARWTPAKTPSTFPMCRSQANLGRIQQNMCRALPKFGRKRPALCRNLSRCGRQLLSCADALPDLAEVRLHTKQFQGVANTRPHMADASPKIGPISNGPKFLKRTT